MYLQLKLTSPKPLVRKNIIILAIGISIIGMLLIIGTLNSCGVQHLEIIDELQKYDETIDPDSCDFLVNRILEFNDNCNGEIEIIDCG